MAEKTIKMLVEEHKNILRVAEAMETECDKIASGMKGVDEAFFKKAIQFIRDYADKYHHAKEENILFKELCSEEAKGKMHCNPVEQMLLEHDEGRKLVLGIEEGMKEKDKMKVVENAMGYVSLIREHIFKEDNILYPMAEQALSKESQNAMLKKFLTEDKKLGKEKENSLGILKEFGKR